MSDEQHIDDLADWLNEWSDNYQNDIPGYMRMKRIPFMGSATGPFSEPKVYEFWTEVAQNENEEDPYEITTWVTDQRWSVVVREIL